MTDDLLRDSRPPFYLVEHGLLDRGLGPTPVAVYNVLARHADRQRRCFPSIRSMAKTLGIGKSSVERALESLKSVGAIRVTPRFDDRGDRSSNLYELPTLMPGGCPATGTPVPSQVHGVPPQVHGCPATRTELYPIEQQPLNNGGAAASDQNQHQHRSLFLGYWSERYFQDRGKPYRIRRGEADAALRIVRDCGGLEEAKQAADRMIRSSDKWVRANTRIAILETQLNRFLGEEDATSGRGSVPVNAERRRILAGLGA